jgi:CrcB protein
MKQILLVGAGGFAGSVLRFKIGGWVLHHFDTKFPAGTVVVNLVGCLIIGILSGLAEKRHLLSPDTRLLLITGFLGGFTTFSAFGLETMSLLRRGKLLWALLNIGLSVLGGLLMVWSGFKAVDALPQKSKATQQASKQL